MAWFDPFRDRVVMVTGASSGIGRATALAFGAAGARVALVARRRRELETLAREMDAEVMVVPTDVTDRSAVRAAFDAVDTHFGRIDIVVSNAGILRPSPVLQIDEADLERMLRVNLFGALYVVQEAVPRMLAQRDGVVVNVASLGGRRGVSPIGGYCATKFALIGLTEALREELLGTNVHVALVEPGVVETPMVQDVTHDQEFLEFWPQSLNMPPSWVVWAIFAAARFRLAEISVPPGAGTLEKLASLAPGVSDALVHWLKTASHWLAAAPRADATHRDA
jgi:NAD(P)-dependent dehydrogenase (short-subunit alcohol dehydrogenase family)